jgi:ribonuclease J
VNDNRLRIIPLGGLGEIGRNMLVFEYNDDLVVVDAGLMFPDTDMLGVDIVLPDMSYLYQHADQVRGIIITHGHEDHIGALPYLLERVHAPVYATALTRGLIEVKLPEAQVRTAEMYTIKGTIVHSGDFKFDHKPVDGRPTDFDRLASLGAEGVLLLLSDSTNAERAGYTPSESVLGETLARMISEAEGRVIVASFASNISRIQQVIDASVRLGRRVAIVGRSMVRNVTVARSLGYLNVDDDALLPVDQIDGVDPQRVTVLCTGSQGEPTSALVRMGKGEYRAVTVGPGDSIIVSASPIPGNEEMINRTLDALFRLGASVYYDEVMDVHVSGHASQEEQKMLLNLVRPRYFVPIHGEYRHLVWHSRLAEQCGVLRENIFVLESGQVLEIDEDGPRRAGKVTEGIYYVDGSAVAAMEQSIQAERSSMSRNGVLVATVVLDKYTNSIVGEPHLESRGFMYEAETDGIAERIKAEIVQVVARGGSRSEMLQRLDTSLKRMALAETGRRPIVIPVLLKV